MKRTIISKSISNHYTSDSIGNDICIKGDALGREYSNKRDEKRLVLGTAQLGMPYGVANRSGQPDQDTAREIIRVAWECGIRIFDTAQGYGQSEAVLGEALLQSGFLQDARVITKFHPSLDHTNKKELRLALDHSLSTLGVDQLEGIFFHREQALDLWSKGLDEIVFEIHASGKAAKVGISVYSPERALEALEMDGIDVIQIPTNILDHRFETLGVFTLAKEKEKRIYIRSIFLQGLLLLDLQHLIEKMQYAGETLKKAHAIAHAYGIPIKDLALGYVKQSHPDVYPVIGAETPIQVRETCDLWERVSLPQSVLDEIQATFKSVDEHILNPSKWQL